MSVDSLLREKPLTRSTLSERGLRARGTWATHIGLDTSPCVYFDWHDEPNRHELVVAEYLVVVSKTIHIEPDGKKPWLE